MFAPDPDHWLFKLSPEQWMNAAMNELKRAEDAYKRRDVRAGLAGAKRAAGMALNGALIVKPNDAWGRSYVEHVEALAKDPSAPKDVRDACALLLRAPSPGSTIVGLRTKTQDDKVLEAARDVMAHALSIVMQGWDLPNED